MTTQIQFGDEMSQGLSHLLLRSSCERLFILHAMRLLHSPTMRRPSSLIEVLALDDNHTRTTLQFVSRKIGQWRCPARPKSHGLATAQSVSFWTFSVPHNPINGHAPDGTLFSSPVFRGEPGLRG